MNNSIFIWHWFRQTFNECRHIANAFAFAETKTYNLNIPYLSKFNAALIIGSSGLISWLIANIGIEYGRLEMGALANMFLPPVVAVVTTLLFLFFDWTFSKLRFWLVLVFAIANLWTGIDIRMESV